MVVDAHFGGMPVEEALLGLIPLASVLILMTQLAARRLRQAVLSTVRRTRKERP
jgi:hypothetical protein